VDTRGVWYRKALFSALLVKVAAGDTLGAQQRGIEL